MGSAPTHGTSNRGIEDLQIKLGCAQPGESPQIFGDALRRLTDRSTHLYVEGRRFWYSTQPTVGRLAEDRAGQLSPDDVIEEIRRRLRDEAKNRGDFVRVHPAASGSDVPDEPDARLVLIDPEHPHTPKSEDSAAKALAASILETRAAGPRAYRNSIVFLAADRQRLEELKAGVRQYLAWKSIEEEKEALNLDTFQRLQAKKKHSSANDTVKSRIPETFSWLLVPTQKDTSGPIE